MDKKKCLYCGNEFEPNKPKQVFCSAKCRVYFNREGKKGESMEVVDKPKIKFAAPAEVVYDAPESTDRISDEFPKIATVKPKKTIDDLKKIVDDVISKGKHRDVEPENKPQRKTMEQWVKDINGLEFEAEYMSMSQRIEQDEDLTRREKDQLLTHMRSGKI